MATLAIPVQEPERINSLDTLRGFALLGILVMNIWAFAMPFGAYFNPYLFGSMAGANWWAWPRARPSPAGRRTRSASPASARSAISTPASAAPERAAASGL